MKCNYMRPPLLVVDIADAANDCYEREDYVDYFYWMNKLYTQAKIFQNKHEYYRTWQVCDYILGWMRQCFTQLLRKSTIDDKIKHMNIMHDVRQARTSWLKF